MAIDSMKYLETQYFNDANQKFEATITELSDIKLSIETTTNALLQVWVGESRNEFENQYNQLFSKISDIKDALDEVYDALVEAETAYIEVDDGIREKVIMS